jgi:predicted RecA/RadA family phage recombinase
MALNVVIEGDIKDKLTAPVASTVVAGTFVTIGGIRGVAINTPRVGSDGLYYSTIDTSCVFVVPANAVAFAAGAPVYVAADNVTFSASTTSTTLVGIAWRAKSSASGNLFVKLIPGALTA